MSTTTTCGCRTTAQTRCLPTSRGNSEGRGRSAGERPQGLPGSTVCRREPEDLDRNEAARTARIILNVFEELSDKYELCFYVRVPFEPGPFSGREAPCRTTNLSPNAQCLRDTLLASGCASVLIGESGRPGTPEIELLEWRGVTSNDHVMKLVVARPMVSVSPSFDVSE